MRAIASGLLLAAAAAAQYRQEPGKSIGKVSTRGDLVVMELNEGALGEANLFGLGRRTLRFTPDAAGYLSENLPLQWDSEFGEQLTGAPVSLHKF